MAVFEKTKRGWPHLHILYRGPWIAQSELSEMMAEIDGSPIVDIRRISSKKKAAAYVAKYVGKEPTAFEGCKRYWRSIDYMIDHRPMKRHRAFDGTEWYVSKWSVGWHVRRLKESGWRVAVDKSVIEFEAPEAARAPP